MASNKTLTNLFKLLCDELNTQLKEGKKILDKEGNIVSVSPDAAVLNVVRQLLKDNGIEADPEKNEDLNALRNSLPFTGDFSNDSNQLQ